MKNTFDVTLLAICIVIQVFDANANSFTEGMNSSDLLHYVGKILSTLLPGDSSINLAGRLLSAKVVGHMDNSMTVSWSSSCE